MLARKRRKGQALIETSLVIIALLVTIVGIMDFGQFLFFYQSLSDRARAGARYAIANTCCSSSDITAIRNIVAYNTATAPAGDPAPTGLFGLLPSYVTVTPTPGGGTPSLVEVKIDGFPISFLSPFMTKAVTYPTIRVVRQAEALGATN